MSVRFGTEDTKCLGYTVDVSCEGLFIESSSVFAQGAPLKVQLTTRNGETILLDGKVQWAKKYAARYSQKLRSGMGVRITRFHEGEETFQGFCPREECLDCKAVGEES